MGGMRANGAEINFLRNPMTENPIERGPEGIPTKEEVLSVIGAHVENAERISVIQELFDEQGLYFLEVRVEVENDHDETRYEYTRKGVYLDGNASAETVIHVVFYRDGEAVGGHNIAEYSGEAGRWETIV